MLGRPGRDRLELVLVGHIIREERAFCRGRPETRSRGSEQTSHRVVGREQITDDCSAKKLVGHPSGVICSAMSSSKV